MIFNQINTELLSFYNQRACPTYFGMPQWTKQRFGQPSYLAASDLFFQIYKEHKANLLLPLSLKVLPELSASQGYIY